MELPEVSNSTFLTSLLYCISHLSLCIAFSEQVPVLHLVGVPSTTQQKLKPMLHHTLGDGRYDAYEIASEQFTITQGSITDKKQAAAEIDRVLIECITRARPAYLMLPTNIAFEKISAADLQTPLTRHPPVNDTDVEKFVLDEIVRLVEEADQDVVVLVDACAIRHDVRHELQELLEKTKFPVYSAPMGKGAVNEQYERYGGVSTMLSFKLKSEC
jgi:pyruvate decarboxylase